MVIKRGEFELISDIFAPLASGYPGSLNLCDDAAVLSISQKKELVVTSDTIVEGVHFLPDDPPDTVGTKALAVNLSDLAAMGAKPHSYMFSATWSPPTSTLWIEAFASGLKHLQELHQIHLVGGDTVSTPGPLTLTITAFGLIDEGKSIQRNTANIGDNLYVTGNIGDSALGLRVAKNEMHHELSPKSKARLIERYRSPTPRVEIGMSLPGYATSAIDISDGLLADVGHIAKESGVQIRIRAQRVPVSEIAQRLLRTDPGLMDLIFGGGDDYELAFTAPPSTHQKIVDLANKVGVRITEIGDVLATKDCPPGIDLRGQKNEIIKSPYSGYSHF